MLSQNWFCDERGYPLLNIFIHIIGELKYFFNL
jgi:hypothetical protein